jgi:hypothetical protein
VGPAWRGRGGSSRAVGAEGEGVGMLDGRAASHHPPLMPPLGGCIKTVNRPPPPPPPHTHTAPLASTPMHHSHLHTRAHPAPTGVDLGAAVGPAEVEALLGAASASFQAAFVRCEDAWEGYLVPPGAQPLSTRTGGGVGGWEGEGVCACVGGWVHLMPPGAQPLSTRTCGVGRGRGLDATTLGCQKVKCNTATGAPRGCSDKTSTSKTTAYLMSSSLLSSHQLPCPPSSSHLM